MANTVQSDSPQGPAKAGTTIDPSKNVLDLVEAAIRRLDDLMEAGTKRLDERLDALSGSIVAEGDKSTSLRAQREFYEARIEGLLERQADKSAILLAQTVDKVTERLAVVEKNQYTSGGQTSVRDPLIAAEIAKMNATLEVLSKVGNKSEGKTESFSQLGAIVLGVCTIIATIIAATAFVIARS